VANESGSVRRPQDALRESEARFRTLAECAPVVVWMTDTAYRCTYISRHWRELTGRDPEADLGFRWVEALHPRDRDRAARDLMEAGAAKQPCSGEYRVMRADGEYGWLQDYGVPHFNADGSYAGHIGTCIDVTQHKLLESAGVEVQNSLVLGQEAERKRVAKELHDDISQRLALVVLELNSVEQLLPASSKPVEEKLRAARHHLETIALDIHRISHNLHPSALSHVGLASALRGLCREFSQRTGIAVDFTGDMTSAQVSPDVAIALYRVTQEGLANIVRHSGSREARVLLVEGQGSFQLTIADAGVGFDARLLPESRGLGFVSIRERARMIGADVSITSAARQGTTIELRVPVASAANQAGEAVTESGV
jgi:PAS domain S-box-containing protein